MNSGKNDIVGRFRLSVSAFPERSVFHFFSDGWQTMTYRDLARRVEAGAARLINKGVREGDRAAIISENRPEWAVAYLSTILAGAIAVPIDPGLGPAEICNLLRDSSAKVVFHTAGTAGPVSSCLGGLLQGGNTPRLIDLDSAEPALPAEEASFRERSPEDIASIIYTSGTTGRPKGVVLTHGNFCSDADGLIEAGLVNQRDNVLSVLPLHHTYAFMCTFLVPVFLGASVTFPCSLKGSDLTEAMQQRGVSVLVAVPQLLSMIRSGIMGKIGALSRPLPFILNILLRAAGLIRRKLKVNMGRLVFRSVHRSFGKEFRFFASGGARLDPEVMADLEALGFSVLEGYGLTETSPVVTFNPPGKRKPGSVGRPLSSVQVRILNPSESGEGEIAVKGPVVMKGYYRNPSATEESISEGWFRTGDIGYIDEEGYLFVTGRSKEVIVLPSGKNIYPEEVEKFYLASLFIKEICVLGLQKDGRSESLHAVVVPDLEHAKEEQTADIREKIKWEINEISAEMPSYMRVTGFTLSADPLPRTALGKIRRFMVKESLTGRTAPEKGGEASKAVTDEVAKKIVGLLHEITGTTQPIGTEDSLELDVGLDSLSRIELAASLERTFSLKLPEDFLNRPETVGELIERIRAGMSEGVAAALSGRPDWKQILSATPPEESLKIVSLRPSACATAAAFIVHSFLRLLFLLAFRLRARDVGNIPDQGNFILASNHSSYLDGFAVILSLPFSCFRRIYTLGLSDFFAGPVKGRFARIAHVIPIDSASFLNKALQVSSHVLREGRSLSVFPEGGRSVDGSLMEFKKGVGILAVELGIPVVPVYIRGAYEALPRGAAWPKCRMITVTFGRPLNSADMDFGELPEGKDRYQLFADALRELVQRLKGQAAP